jgi:hypothetical protein
MSWCYRVMRKETGDKDGPYMFGIHEVFDFKDDKGRRVHPWTTDPMDPHGATLDELRRDLAYMQTALDKPVLDYKTGKPIKA